MFINSIPLSRLGREDLWMCNFSTASPLLTMMALACSQREPWLACSLIFQLSNLPTLYCTVACSNTGVMQPILLEPDLDSRGQDEELLVQSHLHVDASECCLLLKLQSHPCKIGSLGFLHGWPELSEFNFWRQSLVDFIHGGAYFNHDVCHST